MVYGTQTHMHKDLPMRDMISSQGWLHPVVDRRAALQAGTLGLIGLGSHSQTAARLSAEERQTQPQKSVLFIFLTGGISQHDSFDPKPLAPDTVRGEFAPIETVTPGILLSEHLPELAKRSNLYSLVRSIGTNTNAHELGCHALLTGRLDLPPGFDVRNIPSVNEWPSIPSQVTYLTRGRNNLPSAVVLPQPSVNEIGRVRPGQYAGKLGSEWEAWHANVAAPCALGNGCCPHCFRFDEDTFEHGSKTVFETPMLTLPQGGSFRLKQRLDLLGTIEQQHREMARVGAAQEFDQHRRQALSVLMDRKTSKAFEVEQADPKILARYGKHKFGLSLLMGFRLIEAGVNFVQVNLGKNSSWDTHRRNFVNLKRNLLPYLDQSVSALLDNLAETGLLESTLVIVTGEFGRTPIINKDAGRDHWGPVMSSLFAGAGVRGGSVVGASDNLGAQPVSDLQSPENIAATIYETLGIPRDAHWTDMDHRPHELYRAEPIWGLFS